MITKNQYLELCEVCDKILYNKKSTFYLISVPWLHVIRAHPIFLSQYKDVFVNNKIIFYFKFIFKDKIKFIGSFLKIFCKSIFQSKSFIGNLEENNIDVLFISHIINVNDLNTENDFYFGDIPNLLRKNGKKNITILINQTKNNSNNLNKNINDNTKIILNKILSLKKEFKFFLILFLESVKLFILSFKQSTFFYKKVYFTASKNTLSSKSQNVLRINYQINEIVNKYKPKLVLLTHEGHSWERITIHSIKKLNQNTKIFAYQHSAIFKYQHAIMRKLASLYNPDLILTSGSISKNQLINSDNLKDVAIKILGSNRVYSFNDNIVLSNERNHCIVLPEGIISECKILFEFSLDCAIKNPEVIFIWRLHPLINFNQLNFKIKDLPSNIICSSNNLIDDILQSKWALYRGSTSIITAVQAGLTPIYVKLKNEISIDPLYQIENFKHNINNIEEFSEIIKSKLPNKFQYNIIDYVNNFYKTYDINILLNEL